MSIGRVYILVDSMEYRNAPDVVLYELSWKGGKEPRELLDNIGKPNLCLTFHTRLCTYVKLIAWERISDKLVIGIL